MQAVEALSAIGGLHSRPVGGRDRRERGTALVAFAEQATGGVDVLINNAGLGGTRLVDMSDDEWLKVIDITLNGTMRMTRAMLKVMQERRARRYCQQCVGVGLAGAARAMPLCGSQSGRDGPNALRRSGGGGIRYPNQRCVAEHCHA